MHRIGLLFGLPGRGKFCLSQGGIILGSEAGNQVKDHAGIRKIENYVLPPSFFSVPEIDSPAVRWGDMP